MQLWSVVLHIGAIASTYFLVTMLSALVHGDPETRARLQAVGLAASLILMMAAALFRPFPAGAEPAQSPPPRYPPRLPAAPFEESMGRVPVGSGVMRA